MQARVVLFTGGRGSEVLSRQLLKDPRVHLTLAINGYDDGASTGEIRRFLGDSLGPSDFRKNAGRLALELNTCRPALVHALDARLADASTLDIAVRLLDQRLSACPDARALAERFTDAVRHSPHAFDFDDCSVGNLVFAGAFLAAGRVFNRAVDDYCALLGLPAGLVENVTGGEAAHLVAVTDDDTVLATEAAIVDANGRLRIRDIFLLDRPLTADDRARLASSAPEERARFFRERQAALTLNPRLAARLADADLIIYAPGTQHSSLFPSYLTPGLADLVAANLTAIKLLVTNIQTDAEIAGASAVDLIERALHYMNQGASRVHPPPCLISHCLINDPAHREAAVPYVPLGQIEMLEDPRLVRIANYEDGVSGRHDASKVLLPFIQSLAGRDRRQRVLVLLDGAASPNKTTQTLLEMVRAGIARVPVEITVLHGGEPLEPQFVTSLPFAVAAIAADAAVDDLLDASQADYVVLFEASGMYRGEDLAGIAAQLAPGRLDAVWGSRRLSARDIDESIRWRYERSPLLGLLSRVGSHVLSLACLALYGRYISDTLSGVRAVRRADARALDVPLSHPHVNQHLLSRLLRRKADLVELPVQFLPLSPERVRRVGVLDGIGALETLVAGRFKSADREGDAPDRVATRITYDHSR